MQSLASPRPLRVFTIGNSFAANATQLLPDLAREAGHRLEMGAASIGGCSRQTHWELHRNGEKPCDGQSRSERLRAGTWDVVTLQQASMDCANASSYLPRAAVVRFGAPVVAGRRNRLAPAPDLGP